MTGSGTPTAPTGQVSLVGACDPLLLAIDVGTSSARAIIYDAQASLVQGLEAHQPYAMTTTADGGVEIDAEYLCGLAALCIDEVMQTVRRAGRKVAAVTCDTFWHSLVGVNRDGKAVTPVYTWADTRSNEAAIALQREVDQQAVHERTGAMLHACYLPAKLRWLRTDHHEHYDSAAYWMSFGEYLYLTLFGERRVSISMASGSGLLDQRSCDWDGELLRVLGLDPDRLSPLSDYAAAMTGLRSEYARRWPDLRSLLWYLPLGDGACNNIGSGGSCPEWPVLMIGTSGAIRIVRDENGFVMAPDLWTYRVDRRRVVQGGALSSGGNVFAWLTHTLRTDPAISLEQQAAAVPADSHGMTVLPFLAGERSPRWNPRSHAVMEGMTLDTTPGEVTRAWLEAVAYEFAQVFDSLTGTLPALHGIIGSGVALLHSPVWMEIMTDVLERPITASTVAEATSRGAALLGLEAMGLLGDLSSVSPLLGETTQPNPERGVTYRQARIRHRERYAQLMG